MATHSNDAAFIQAMQQSCKLWSNIEDEQVAQTMIGRKFLNGEIVSDQIAPLSEILLDKLRKSAPEQTHYTLIDRDYIPSRAIPVASGIENQNQHNDKTKNKLPWTEYYGFEKTLKNAEKVLKHSTKSGKLTTTKSSNSRKQFYSKKKDLKNIAALEKEFETKVGIYNKKYEEFKSKRFSKHHQGLMYADPALDDFYVTDSDLLGSQINQSQFSKVTQNLMQLAENCSKTGNRNEPKKVEPTLLDEQSLYSDITSDEAENQYESDFSNETDLPYYEADLENQSQTTESNDNDDEYFSQRNNAFYADSADFCYDTFGYDYKSPSVLRNQNYNKTETYHLHLSQWEKHIWETVNFSSVVSNSSEDENQSSSSSYTTPSSCPWNSSNNSEEDDYYFVSTKPQYPWSLDPSQGMSAWLTCEESKNSPKDNVSWVSKYLAEKMTFKPNSSSTTTEGLLVESENFWDPSPSVVESSKSDTENVSNDYIFSGHLNSSTPPPKSPTPCREVVEEQRFMLSPGSFPPLSESVNLKRHSLPKINQQNSKDQRQSDNSGGSSTPTPYLTARTCLSTESVEGDTNSVAEGDCNSSSSEYVSACTSKHSSPSKE